MPHLTRLTDDQNRVFFQEGEGAYSLIYTPVATAAKLVGIDYVTALMFAVQNCRATAHFTTDDGKYLGYLLTPMQIKTLAQQYNAELYAGIKYIDAATYMRKAVGVHEPSKPSEGFEYDKVASCFGDDVAAIGHFETPLMYMNALERWGLNDDPDVMDAFTDYLINWFECTSMSC